MRNCVQVHMDPCCEFLKQIPAADPRVNHVQHGVLVDGEATLERCRIVENEVGLRIDDTGVASALDTEISRNAGDGVSASGRATLRRCRIEGNGGSGVAAQGGRGPGICVAEGCVCAGNNTEDVEGAGDYEVDSGGKIEGVTKERIVIGATLEPEPPQQAQAQYQ